MEKYTTIDEYILQFPPDVQKKLESIRQLGHELAPKAQEAISYGIPTFKLKGNLFHFAGYKNHIGFYPSPRALEEFREELSHYQGGKGTVQFPLNQDLPLDLLRRIILYRIKENISIDH